MPVQGEEKTETAYGMDNILLQVIERWNLTEFTIDSYIDKLHPISLLTIEPIKQGVIGLINKGVKIRAITEITEDNSTALNIPKEFSRELDIENSKVSMSLLDDFKGNRHLVIPTFHKEIVID